MESQPSIFIAKAMGNVKIEGLDPMCDTFHWYCRSTESGWRERDRERGNERERERERERGRERESEGEGEREGEREGGREGGRGEGFCKAQYLGPSY